MIGSKTFKSDKMNAIVALSGPCAAASYTQYTMHSTEKKRNDYVFRRLLMRSQVLYWAAQVYSTWHMVHSVQYNKMSQEKKKQGGRKS